MDTITITVTVQELEAIGTGVAELPFKIAQPILEKLTRQYKDYQAVKAANELDKKV